MNCSIQVGSATVLVNGLNSTFESQNRTESASHSLSLSRAFDCLNRCIILCSDDDDDDQKRGYLEAARVLLAYVSLEQSNPSQVINLAEVMFKEKPLSSLDDKRLRKISLRRRATMRLYACEALSMMGISNEGEHYLNNPDPNNSDSFNPSTLAAHLAAIDTTKKRQLNQAQLKRLNRATASIQLFSSNVNLVSQNVGNAEEEARSACSVLVDEAGMNDLKDAANNSLIQALVCGGKVAEAVKVAKGLK